MKGFFITEAQYDKMVESYDKVLAELEAIKKQRIGDVIEKKMDLLDQIDKLRYTLDTLILCRMAIGEGNIDSAAAEDGLMGIELVIGDIVKCMEDAIKKEGEQ